MKKYMVVKVVRDIGSNIAELIPYLGLLTRETAEQIVCKAANQDPTSKLMIQEVGVA